MAKSKQGARSPASDELLRLVVESARDYAIFSMDRDGLVTSWNTGSQQLLGWSEAEIIGSTADVIFTPEDRAAGVPHQERIQAATAGRASDDRWQQRKDGERFWASGLMMPLEDVEQGFVKILRDRTEKHLADERLRQSEDRQKMLMAELEHRSRNLLGVVQAIAMQTVRRSTSLAEFEREFVRRVEALARVQGVIGNAEYRTVDLRDLVAAELQAHYDEQLQSSRARFNGPTVSLSAAAAQTLGLALHELATNAVKYGALAHETGRLMVDWRIETRKGKQWTVLTWKESGVTLPPAAHHAGYGREPIERALPYQLGAETRFEFVPDGVQCTIAVPLQGHPRRWIARLSRRDSGELRPDHRQCA
jgi:PAS domain S-box-containing protein